MAKTILTAERIIINLGEIELEVFLTESNEYRLSKKQTFESVGVVTKDTPRWLKTRSLKPLPSLRLNISKNGVGGTVDSIGIPEAVTLWSYVGNKEGNELAATLVLACAIEAIERRADKKFNIIRTEQEYNDKIIARMQGIGTRRLMTDSIQSWCNRNNVPEKAQGYCVYCSDSLNVHLFGKKSKQLREERNVKNNALLRDTFNSEELRAIQRIEDRVILLTDSLNIKPTDAMKQVLTHDNQGGN